MKARKKNILIVDDEIIGALSLAENVREWGFNDCQVAGSFEGALAEVKRCGPDLIIMDINLGRNKKNGIETARAILAGYKVPVIFVTGYNISEFQLKNINEPHIFMSKPINMGLLKSNMEFLLSS